MTHRRVTTLYPITLDYDLNIVRAVRRTNGSPTECLDLKVRLDRSVIEEFPRPLRYDPDDPTQVIAYSTAPWLQRGDEPVHDDEFAERWESMRDNDGSCYACWTSLIKGVFAPAGSVHDIERCDNCTTYDDDFEAAEALADHLEHMLHLPAGELTVWFYPHTDTLEDSDV